MPLSEERESWTARMFLAIGGTPSKAPYVWPASAWQQASTQLEEALSAAGQQIEALRSNLKKSKDPDLEIIADRALDDVLGAHPGRLRDLLKGLDVLALSEARAGLEGLSTALDALGDELGQSATVEACDSNPFGVQVSLKETIGAAIGSLRIATAEALSEAG